jgi:protein-arginine kinase
MFSSANYFTAGMSESEIVEELTALIKEILPMAEVQIELVGGKVESIAS